MLILDLPKGTAARGIAAFRGNIYYTVSNSPAIYHLSETAPLFFTPQTVGGFYCTEEVFVAGTYSAADPCIYTFNLKGKLLNSMDYLTEIPPLYLPIEPYTSYVTGVCRGRNESYWISLQNSKFIYNVTRSGIFHAVRQVPLKEDGDPIDIAGICSDGNTLYMSDVSEGRVYCMNMTFGGTHRITLPKKFEPFGLSWSEGNLYVISANFTKPGIAVINVN